VLYCTWHCNSDILASVGVASTDSAEEQHLNSLRLPICSPSCAETSCCCHGRLIAAEKSKEIPSSVILKIVKRDPSYSIVSFYLFINRLLLC